MRFSVRRIAPVLLVACVGLVAGCGSNNKGKIEGKWKVVSFPEKGGKSTIEDMSKQGMYLYLEFKPDGAMTLALGAEKPEMLELIKGFAKAKNQQISWDMKYKLLSGDGVEIYDLPK